MLEIWNQARKYSKHSAGQTAETLTSTLCTDIVWTVECFLHFLFVVTQVGAGNDKQATEGRDLLNIVDLKYGKWPAIDSADIFS